MSCPNHETSLGRCFHIFLSFLVIRFATGYKLSIIVCKGKSLSWHHVFWELHNILEVGSMLVAVWNFEWRCCSGKIANMIIWGIFGISPFGFPPAFWRETLLHNFLLFLIDSNGSGEMKQISSDSEVIFIRLLPDLHVDAPREFILQFI